MALFEPDDGFLFRFLHHAGETVIRIRYILPDDARIFLMFLGRRSYYLNRPYYHEQSFGMNTLSGMVKASADKQDFGAYLQSLDCTHILMRTELVNKYLHDNFPEKTIICFLDITKEYWKPVYELNGYMIMEITQVSHH